MTQATDLDGVGTLEGAQLGAPPQTLLLRPRLWPTPIILGLQILALVLSVTPSINNGIRFGFMMLGPASCVLLFGIWLLFLSRLPWRERFAYCGASILSMIGAGLLVDSSMGVSIWAYGVPLAMLAISFGVFLGRASEARVRMVIVIGLVAVSFGAFLPLKMDGMTGDYFPEYAWRWSASAEERLTKSAPDVDLEPTSRAANTAWSVNSIEWPRFRGADGDSRVTGFSTPLDFAAAPPREVWRTAIGPAWSSFIYVSGRLFTQEQRGESEWVSCYDATSGTLIWHHASTARFSDVVAGAGPRATPTYADGRLYTLGAKALLTCLDATTGSVHWQRDLVKEIQATIPVWGCSSSPLVMNGVVVVGAGGAGDQGLVAYDALSGEPVWHVASSGMNFSSPQRAVLADVECVLFDDANGVMAVEPANGKLLWRFKPLKWSGMVICQPQQIDPTSLIVPLGDGIGIVRLSVTKAGEEWKIEELWSTNQLKPSFNDFVYHDGYCYGFDQHIFVCVDATTGQRKWKRGRYGFGQVLLLADVGQMIVLSDTGELIVVAADPKEPRELGRFPAVKGKTWNHPTLAANRLFVRNGEEAVCLEIAP